MNPNITSTRPEDNAYNIQRGYLTSSNSAKNPCNTSLSPMDDSFPPSKVDYVEHVAANCNINIEITDLSLPPVENATRFSFSLPASNPRVPLEEAPNSINISDIDISAESSLPKSSHTVLMFQQTLVYGMEISRRHLCSAPMNFLTVILTTSRVPYNAWPAS